jgi:hypothetical protein
MTGRRKDCHPVPPSCHPVVILYGIPLLLFLKRKDRVLARSASGRRRERKVVSVVFSTDNTVSDLIYVSVTSFMFYILLALISLSNIVFFLAEAVE